MKHLTLWVVFAIARTICILPMEPVTDWVLLPDNGTEQIEIRGTDILRVFKGLHIVLRYKL